MLFILLLFCDIFLIIYFKYEKSLDQKIADCFLRSRNRQSKLSMIENSYIFIISSYYKLIFNISNTVNNT